MKRGAVIEWVGLAAVAAIAMVAAPARASLTASETEQVRRGVATGSDLARVRALVARPDLSPDEAAAALVTPATTTAFDAAHATFFHDLVFGETSAPSRPVLAPAAIRAALARADAVLGKHALDLGRVPAALGELERAYGFVEEIASAAPAMNVPSSSRAECATALRDHLGRNATVLSLASPVAPPVARVRAQAALALLDLMPDAPTRRIDAADGLALAGPRRALLVERGLLVLDAGASDAHVAALRALFDRFPDLKDGLEAIVVGGDASGLVARDGAVVATGADPGGAAGAALLWGNDVRSPPGDGWTTAVARGLATLAVTRAAERRRADLRVQFERDGGVGGVAAMAAMLAINGPLGVEVAAARLIAGRKESATCLADAIGALAVFASPPARPADGIAVSVGPAKTTGPATTELTHISLAMTGAASTFRLEGHTWTFEHDANGAVSGLRRDGLPVTRAMLVAVKE
jgi:hypothetical protein